jgi:hypothetical protein
MTAAKARAVYGDGTSEEVKVAAFTGSPDQPLGIGPLVDKLRANIEGSEANVDQLVDLVLGNAPDVQLTNFLALLDELGSKS